MLGVFDRDRIAEVLDLGELIACSMGGVTQPMRTKVGDPSTGGEINVVPVMTGLSVVKIAGN